MLAYSRAEGVAELVARGVAHGHVDEDGIEVEGLRPARATGRCPRSGARRRCRSPRAPGRRGRGTARRRGSRTMISKRSWPFGADELAALLPVAGLGEQRERLALAGAVALAALALVGLGGGGVQDVADLGRELGEERLEDRLLVGRGDAVGHHVAALPVAGGAHLDPVEEGRVDPLEVEHGLDRLAHARVLPGFAAQVEEDAAGEGHGAGGELGGHHVAALLRREVVAGQPAVGVDLAAEGVLAGLERLEGARLVGVVVEAELVEVVGARRSPAGPWPSSRGRGCRRRCGRRRRGRPGRGRSRAAGPWRRGRSRGPRSRPWRRCRSRPPWAGRSRTAAPWRKVNLTSCGPSASTFSMSPK